MEGIHHLVIALVGNTGNSGFQQFFPFPTIFSKEVFHRVGESRFFFSLISFAINYFGLTILADKIFKTFKRGKRRKCW